MRKSGEGVCGWTSWDRYRVQTYLCHIGKFTKGHNEIGSLNQVDKMACPVYLSVLLQPPRIYSMSLCTK